MSVLTLAPKNWFTWNFSVRDGARTLADVRLSSWRDAGTLSVEGIEYVVSRETWLGDFLLQQSGPVLARATRPTLFRRSFVITYKERSYTLKAQSMFRRTFVVLDGAEKEIGSIVPTNMFTRKSVVTLPDDWPLPVESFAMWLTMVHWKRDQG